MGRLDRWRIWRPARVPPQRAAASDVAFSAAAGTHAQAIVDTAMEAIIAIDESERVLLFNRSAERMFGITAGRALGMPIDRFIPAKHRSAHAQHVRDFGRSGVTARRMGGTVVLRALRVGGPHAGEEFPIEASIAQATVGEQRFFAAILRDVSERVAAEHDLEHSYAELRALSRSTHAAIESERSRVARELHDELGQQLAALKIDLAVLEDGLAAHQRSLRERVVRMTALASKAVESTRRIAAELRPLALDDLGLEAALDWLVARVRERTGIAIALAVDPSLAEVDEPLASAVFRIVQQSLSNIGKHSGATRAEITFREIGEDAVLEVRDNGVGLPEPLPIQRDATGLLEIKERARLLGGRAIIANRADGHGVGVTVHLPLAPSRTEEERA